MAIAFNPDHVNRGERCRVWLEGGYITDEVNIEYADYDNGMGRLASMPISRSRKIVVQNPDTVWVQSLHPDKVHERITGEYPNPDAVLIQTKLDAAEKELARLNAQIAKMREGYEASKVLWRKKQRDKWWLTDATVEGLLEAMAAGEPEPDPYDY